MALPDFADTGTALTALLAALTAWIGLKVRKMARRDGLEELPQTFSLSSLREDIDRLEASVENLAKEAPEIRAKLREVRHEMFNELQKHITNVERTARDLEKRVRYAELDLARMGADRRSSHKPSDSR